MKCNRGEAVVVVGVVVVDVAIRVDIPLVVGVGRVD